MKKISQAPVIALLSATRVFELYRKHAKEVTGVVNQAMADAITGRRWRDLPGGCLLRLVFETPSGEDAEQTAPSPAGNYFVSRGKYWGIRFGDGDVWSYPKERGYDYLRLLLDAPTKHFSAVELDRLVRCQQAPSLPMRNGTADAQVDAKSTLHTGDDLHDEEYRADLHTSLPTIDEAIARARASGTLEGIERADELERQKKQITAELAKSKDRLGRPRKLGGERDRVCNAIRRALRQIANEDPPLAGYLKPPTLNLGHNLSYVPGLTSPGRSRLVRCPEKKRGYTKSSLRYAGRIAMTCEAWPGEPRPASRPERPTTP